MPVTKSRKMAKTRRQPLRRKYTTRRKAIRRQRGGVNETLYLNATGGAVPFSKLSIYELQDTYNRMRNGQIMPKHNDTIRLISLSTFKSRKQDDTDIAGKITFSEPNQYNFSSYSKENKPILCNVVKWRLTQTLDAILQKRQCNQDVIIEAFNYVIIDLLKGNKEYIRKGSMFGGISPEEILEDHNTVLGGERFCHDRKVRRRPPRCFCRLCSRRMTAA